MVLGFELESAIGKASNLTPRWSLSPPELHIFKMLSFGMGATSVCMGATSVWLFPGPVFREHPWCCSGDQVVLEIESGAAVCKVNNCCIVSPVQYFLFGVGRGTPGNTQGLLLALHSEVTPGSALETI